VTAFAPPVAAGNTDSEITDADAAPAQRPSRWALSNWPVRWKVLAIVVIPTILAVTFGGIRIYTSANAAADLRLAADRAEMVAPIESYMSALEGALLVNSTGGDTQSARNTYDLSRADLQKRAASTNVASDVRAGIKTILDGGQALLDKVASNTIGLRDRVTTYAPILLTAEDAIDASVRVDRADIRTKAQGLSRAVGARGQMLMQQLLVNLGGELPEPELRTSMMTLAGTEPSTLFGMSQVLGVGSPDAHKLQQQMVSRMAIMSDPSSVLVGNPQLLQSLQTTDQIANRVINDTTKSVSASVENLAATARTAAIRNAAVVLAAIAVALLLVFLVARSLVGPLRRLRSGALRVAHEDLADEVARVRAGEEPPPIQPIPVHTTEEVGQVAHAVDELHEQALLLAAEQAQLQLQIGDMFETLSRRSRSLVDQQLSLIDRLERNEDDPERLDSLFKLDHLAARMRRNGTNLLVLSGGKVRREQSDSVPVATVINAAASQVEDYPRVEIATVPDSALLGSAAGDVVHLLAELIDNALRYSPPTAPVRVSAVHTGSGGLVIEVSDTGLGMTEADMRMANTRLGSGGEVTPFTARHMGLFVAGRLAEQHGLVVRLRSSVLGQPDSGTTAGVYVPAELIAHGPAHGRPRPQEFDELAPEPRAGSATGPALDSVPNGAGAWHGEPELLGAPHRNGTAHDVSTSTLPRRNPGASGIAEGPAAPPPAVTPQQPDAPAAHAEGASEPSPPEPSRAPADTSAYFSSRAHAASNGTSQAAESERADTDVIYQRMLSEWLIDMDALTQPPQSWESVWDNGWAAAAQAADAPVDARTDQGLAMRRPGARLIPGSAEPDAFGHNGAAHRKPEHENGVASAGGNPLLQRDPDAVRTSLSNHWGGVRAGRSHARESHEEMDSE
jgi:signal transduction histidine kinase